MTHRTLVALLLLALAACSKSKPEERPEDTTQGAGIQGGGAVPPDGKYENVKVEGRTVPMVSVMNKGSVVLVDTDGVKPRTWEEQFKRKGNTPAYQFNLHKTNVNKNETFEDDPIDREGLWSIDEKGNIEKR